MKKEEVLEQLQHRIDNNQSIRYADIKKEDSSLLYKIEKHGGVASLAQELGISRIELVEKYGLSTNILPPLPEKEIKKRLLFLKSIGRLTTSAMRTDFSDTRLEASLKRLFGSVKLGLEHFHLEPDSKAPSKERLLKEVRSLSEKQNVAYSDMMKTNPTLIYSVRHQFKMGWHEFLEKYDIDFKERRIPFTRESIESRLLNVKNLAGDVNYSTIRTHDNSILNYVWENYESIFDFLEDFGYEISLECRKDELKQKGFIFESLFKEVLDSLNIEYSHNKYFNSLLRPDFQLLNKKWVDCKLSSWTPSINSTIEKYTPHCNSLLIVFARGEEKHLESFAHEKVEFRKIDYYYPFLETISRQDLIEKFEELKV